MPQRQQRSKPPSKSTAGDARKLPRNGQDAVARKLEATNALASAFPFNRDKPAEFGEGARNAKPGTAETPDDTVGGSTLSETTSRSIKAGARAA